MVVQNNEIERVAKLRSYAILDTPPESTFDDITRLAAQICEAPMSAISLVESDRQWFKSTVGLEISQTPRDVSFCAHTILGDQCLIVQDTQTDPRFDNLPLVTGNAQVRFYAGAPLMTSDGFALGALCVLDTKPRELRDDQIAALQMLSRLAVSQIESRHTAAIQTSLLEDRTKVLTSMLESQNLFWSSINTMREGFIVHDADGILMTCNERAEEILGMTESAMLGTSVLDHGWRFIHEDGSEFPREFYPTRVALKSGEAQHDVLIGFVWPNRSVKWLLMTAAPLTHIGESKPYAVVSTFADITEKLHDAKKLHETLTLQHAILDAANYAIISTSLDGTIATFNDAAERMLGYRADEVIDTVNLTQWHDPEELQKRALVLTEQMDKPIQSGFEALVAACREGKADENEWTYIRKDGSRFHVRLSVTTLRDDEARITGYLGIACDNTDRKMFEDALFESEERFRTSVNAMEEGLIVKDAGGVIQLCNQSAERILGLSAAQMMECSTVGLQGPVVREDGRDYPNDEHPSLVALQTGQAQRNVILGSRKPNGELTWLLTHSVPLFRHGENAAYATVTTFSDITKARHMLHALQESEARFRLLAENSSDMISRHGPDGKYLYASPAAQALLGYEPDELLGTHPCTSFHPEDLKTVIGSRSKAKTPTDTTMVSYRMRHKNGHYVWLETISKQIIDPMAGALSEVHCASRDVTKRKQQEDQIREYSAILEKQKAELEEANRRLLVLATTDGLTGLDNHRSFQTKLKQEFHRAERYQLPLSVVMLDVDRFKQYNDTFGHPAGDEVLKSVAQILQQEARDADIVSRYGGEEFVILLPQTDAYGAITIAERIRRIIERTQWEKRQITASFGICQANADCPDSATLVAFADRALYVSKQNGRNRVSLFRE